MWAWRLARAIDRSIAFSGIGPFRFGGRWNSKSRYAFYVSLSLSTAALEILVHAGTPRAIPKDELAIRISIPDDLAVYRVEFSDLPDDWQEFDSPACVAIGDAWLDARKSAILSVPSAVVPQERNLMLNPTHPDFARIDTSDPGTLFRWDPRLVSFMVVPRLQ